MNRRIFVTIICLTLLGEYAHSQNAPDSKGKNNAVSRSFPPPFNQWNKFPNWGNAGIGTTSPSEKLEVIGNVKVSQTIFTHALESSTFINGGTLNLSGNGIVNGNLGLGVPSPTERLDVLGNIKLSGNLSGQGLSVQTLNANSGVFNTLTVNQNSSFNGLASFSENVTFSKDAFVTGKFGIGISSPSEVLDVLGNIKSSGGLFSSSLNTGSAQLSSLNVSDNSIFNGLVGISVTSPSEKLHIGGNLKVDNTIFSNALTTSSFQTGQLSASGLASFSENASFAKDLLITGRLGIGVSAPAESLDINGNIMLTGGINAATLNVGQGTFEQGLIAGNTSINGDLQVSGQLTAQSLSLSDISATNDVSVGNNLTVTGASQFNGGATLGGNSTANNLEVTQNLSAGNTLTVNGLSQLNGGVNAGGNSSMNNLQVTGMLNAGNISISEINSNGNATIGQNLSVTGEGVFGSNVRIGGNSSVNGDLDITGKLTAGTFSLNEINTTGNATIAQNLVVNGSGQIGSDLIVNGNLKAGVIEATEFRAVGGGSPFNFENAKISQTLSIATSQEVPSNYKLAVGGNIIATGIDIKIPQKWPDYVFTDGHKLLTIEEVEAYIKINGHLPGVLSADVMEQKQNYSVSEMDAKLLEKVEELTLYIIQLKKEIEELKKR